MCRRRARRTANWEKGIRTGGDRTDRTASECSCSNVNVVLQPLQLLGHRQRVNTSAASVLQSRKTWNMRINCWKNRNSCHKRSASSPNRRFFLQLNSELICRWWPLSYFLFPIVRDRRLHLFRWINWLFFFSVLQVPVADEPLPGDAKPSPVSWRIVIILLPFFLWQINHRNKEIQWKTSNNNEEMTTKQTATINPIVFFSILFLFFPFF